MQTLCSWIYKKICFNSTAYYKAKIQLNSHSANLNFSSWVLALLVVLEICWLTLLWCFLREWHSLEGLRWIVFNHARSYSRLVCALCRKTEQNSKYRNFSTTDFRHGRIRRGCRLFLTIQTFMFESLPCLFIHISLFWSIWSLICSFSLLWHILMVIHQLEIQKCPLMLLFLC